MTGAAFSRFKSLPEIVSPHADTPRRRASSRALATLLAMVLAVGLLFACGGGTANSVGSSSASDVEDVEDESYGEGSTPAAPEPVDPCASGTCTHCGEALCLSGFYCEESESSCGWLPQCAGDLSCDCIGKVLTDCSCEEREGGVYLSCE